ncbi:MAG: NUDIX hydrolase [Paracoccaceae bacterium]
MKAPDDISKLRYVSWIENQAGVLAWLPDTDPVQFAIVTSRRTGRWVFPKGGIDAGLTPQKAAALEALEEAGLVGNVLKAPIGSYCSPKIRPPLIWATKVVIYAMRVEKIHDTWLEIDQRVRKFVTLDEARALLSEPDMIAVAEQFVAAHTGKDKTQRQ